MGATAGVSCSGHDDQHAEDIELQQDLGAPVTVSFQNGVLPTSSYAGNTDSSIKQATATTNYGTAISLEADGDDGSGVDKSALLRWTLSGIPVGSIVQSERAPFTCSVRPCAEPESKNQNTPILKWNAPSASQVRCRLRFGNM